MDEQIEEMRLGRLEFLLMNNPVRRWMQKHVEFSIFLRMLERQRINLHGKAIMDAGCGSGYGTELIIKEFNPSLVTAFDLMPEQIQLARKRRLDVDFRVGDARKIKSADSSFDAVFIYAILHHIPEWKSVLAETVRTLNSVGVLLLEEPHTPRPDWPELEAGIEEAGLVIVEKKPWLFGRYRSYLCQKQPASAVA
jgi:ubiquinone/menaquinone biosynthesis C-methylase UbiE